MIIPPCKRPFGKKSVARVACVTLGFALFASPALAQTSPYAHAPALYNWSGPYVGAHVGEAFSDFDHTGGTAGPDGSASSLIAGGQAGYNWQFNRLVIGGEADVSKIQLQSRNPSSTFNEDYMATFRGRAGYAIDRYLPYVTGGLGLTDAVSKAPGQGQDSRLQSGAVVGAGVDMMLTGWAGDWANSGHWIGRVEYLHADVPQDNDTVGATTVRGGSDNNIVRVGLNYKFF